MADYLNNTSINQQLNDAASSASNVTKNMGGQLMDQASNFSGVVGGLAQDIMGAGASVFGAAKGALNQLGVLSTASKFVDTMTAPKKIPDIRPEQTKGRLLKGPEGMQYPLDLGQYYIRFTFFDYQRRSPTEDQKMKPTATIFMPLPGELAERFGVQYSDKPLGMFGALQESGTLESIGQAARQAFEGGSFKTDDINSSMKNLGSQVSSAGNLLAIGAAASGFSDTALGAGVHRAAGAILNPYQALTFQGIDLRTHSFRFKCSPNSEAEAAALKKIVTTFKQRMLPQKQGLLFNFPDFCTIEFQSRDVPYSFKNCYLKNMSVNYAPSGTPAFFKGGKYAAEIDLQLEFGEIEPVTRNDLEKGSDITGQYNVAYGKSGVNVQASPKPTDPTAVTPSRSSSSQKTLGTATTAAGTITTDAMGNVISGD